MRKLRPREAELHLLPAPLTPPPGHAVPSKVQDLVSSAVGKMPRYP